MLDFIGNYVNIGNPAVVTFLNKYAVRFTQKLCNPYGIRRLGVTLKRATYVDFTKKLPFYPEYYPDEF
jgi:hypothetical protein